MTIKVKDTGARIPMSSVNSIGVDISAPWDMFLVLEDDSKLYLKDVEIS